MENDRVIVHSTMFPQDIAIPQGLLENEGIATFVKDELTAQVNNFYSNALGGVKSVGAPPRCAKGSLTARQ